MALSNPNHQDDQFVETVDHRRSRRYEDCPDEEKNACEKNGDSKLPLTYNSNEEETSSQCELEPGVFTRLKVDLKYRNKVIHSLCLSLSVFLLVSIFSD